MTVTSGGTMNKQAWTPGPWNLLRYQLDETDIEGPLINGKRSLVATAWRGEDRYRVNREQAEANAKLIAKAPEMAEALTDFLGAAEGHRYRDKNHSYDCLTCKAIEKAERILREAGAL